MNVHLTASEVMAAAGALFVVARAWRSAARRARAAAHAARHGARLVSLAGRVVVLAAVIVGVEWLVITRPSVSGWAVVGVLALPALLASYTLTRALTVTTQDGGRR